MRWPFGEWGANAVLSGHDHTYERLNADGVSYFVNGLGGKSKYSISTPLSESEFQYSAEYGAQKVEVYADYMTFSFINVNGDLVDQHTIFNGNQPGNNEPTFVNDPILGKLSAQVSVPYISTLVGDATDLDIDPLSFSKLSGPSWLSVAADGTLSGIPANDDIGLNDFIIKVLDNRGGTDQAVLSIEVLEAPAPPTSGVIDLQISQGIDDVEERKSDGYMYIESTDIEIGDDPNHMGAQAEGLLFRGVFVPQGALITKAYLEFETDEVVLRKLPFRLKLKQLIMLQTFQQLHMI